VAGNLWKKTTVTPLLLRSWWKLLKTHEHDFSAWADKILLYFPIDMPPDFYAFQLDRWRYIEPAFRLGNKILEIGAQTCLACIYLKLRYPDLLVVASDIHPTACKLASSRIKRWAVDVPVVRCDAFDLPFKNDAFNVVLAEGLHEHFDREDVADLVKESARVAKFQIIDVPTILDFQHGGGYGDERKLSYIEWRELFMSINTARILEEFNRATRYGVILERRK
jgi:hypothetical protein